jgi:hypothetical protein
MRRHKGLLTQTLIRQVIGELLEEAGTEIAGLGTFTWQELVALVDVILGGLWTAKILEERESIFLRYQFETIETPPGIRVCMTAGMTVCCFSPGSSTGGLGALGRASVGTCSGVA